MALRKADRIRWFREARFGLFVHWGVYSRLARGEWARLQENIPARTYHEHAAAWTNMKRRPARDWARLARDAGMKYMVMTTKHHDGFCLWDTKQTGFNAVAMGPGRDLVQEYVDACREYGLKIGFYYSLMDWDHADGIRCRRNGTARRRFLDFTQACVRELMTRYGRIDILWYDVAAPLKTAETWESSKMNAMVRRLQPHILINNRSHLPEDFGTPEGEVRPAKQGRPWEACMTLNGDWGFVPHPEDDWLSVRDVIRMLRICAAGNGNLLLNIGPEADGAVPELAVKRLVTIGRWIKAHREALEGVMDPAHKHLNRWNHVGLWTVRGSTAYLWLTGGYPGTSVCLGGIGAKALSAVLLSPAADLHVEQNGPRLVLSGLPQKNPERICGIPVIKIRFAKRPEQNVFRGVTC